MNVREEVEEKVLMSFRDIVSKEIQVNGVPITRSFSVLSLLDSDDQVTIEVSVSVKRVQIAPPMTEAYAKLEKVRLARLLGEERSAL